VRILLVIGTLDVGGSELQLLMLARGLSRSGHQVCVCTLRPGTLGPDFEAAGIEVVHWPATGRYMRSLPWLVREVRRFKPDVVHTWLYAANALGRLAASLARVPVIIGSVRNVDSWKRPHDWLIDYLLSHVTSALVSNSVWGADYAARHALIRRKRFVVIRNGIPGHLMDERHAGAMSRSERFGVLTVCRLMPRKNVSYLIDAMEMLLRRYPDLSLRIVGDGPEATALKQKVKRLGIGDSVEFTGPQGNVGPFYRAADCFVLASTEEGSSNAILEAMACGLPVIASNIRANHETVENGVSGLLVPSRDVAALAEAIERLLLDRKLRERLGSRARQMVRESYAEDRYIEEHVALYRRLVRSAT
jgi:glycosyltransferase involved in cell wall biosynthesis